MNTIILLLTTETRPTERDLIEQVSKLRQQILVARTRGELDRFVTRIQQLETWYGRIEATWTHVERLYDNVLLRHCELIAQPYPICE